MKTKRIFKILATSLFLIGGLSVSAQIVTKKAVDNKGTINTLLDATTSVITSAGNGLTIDNTTIPTNPKVELGGDLTKPTTIIGTTATNLLQVTGLEAGNALTDEIVTIIPATGQLRKLSASAASGTADNGLTKTGNNTQLGGALITPTTITTDITNTLSITGLEPGAANDFIVSENTAGVVRKITATNILSNLNVSNGLTKSTNDVKLGGALTAATTITTTGTETLALVGLTAGNLATDNIVVSTTGGVLKSVAASSLLLSGETNFPAPSVAQSTYNVPNMPADASRVWVYRNGVKLIGIVDYTTTSGIVTLVPAIAGLVVATDNIEVQWVK